MADIKIIPSLRKEIEELLDRMAAGEIYVPDPNVRTRYGVSVEELKKALKHRLREEAEARRPKKPH